MPGESGHQLANLMHAASPAERRRTARQIDVALALGFSLDHLREALACGVTPGHLCFGSRRLLRAQMTLADCLAVATAHDAQSYVNFVLLLPRLRAAGASLGQTVRLFVRPDGKQATEVLAAAPALVCHQLGASGLWAHVERAEFAARLRQLVHCREVLAAGGFTPQQMVKLAFVPPEPCVPTDVAQALEGLVQAGLTRAQIVEGVRVFGHAYAHWLSWSRRARRGAGA